MALVLFLKKYSLKRNVVHAGKPSASAAPSTTPSIHEDEKEPEPEMVIGESEKDVEKIGG